MRMRGRDCAERGRREVFDSRAKYFRGVRGVGAVYDDIRTLVVHRQAVPVSGGLSLRERHDEVFSQ